MYRLKKLFEYFIGCRVYKTRHLPIGLDICQDLKRFSLNDYKFDILFDVGANVGQTARKYSALFPHAKIFSFEPVQASFIELKENTKESINVSCHQVALGSKSEEIEIQLDANPTSQTNTLRNINWQTDKSHKKEVIRIIKLDEFIEQNEIKIIDLLKIDTEGWELEVLNGASKSTFENKIKFILCEVGFTKNNNWHTPFSALNLFINRNGFWLCGIYDIDIDSLPRGWHSGNALWINQNHLKSC